MVTRKPLPEHAALDPAVPQQGRDGWVPTGTGDETIWENETSQRQLGQASNPSGPSHVPDSLRPGGPIDLSFGDESSVWAEKVSAPAGNDDLSRVPSVLRPGSSHRKEAGNARNTETTHDGAPIPTVLRPGSGAAKQETNPFKRKMSLSASRDGSREDLSRPAASVNNPPIPPLPVDAFSQLNINDSSTNPWQPGLNQRDVVAPPPLPSLPGQDSNREDIWGPSQPSQAVPDPRSSSPALLSMPSDEGSAGWEEVSQKPTVTAPLVTTADGEALGDSHAWDDLGAGSKGKAPAQIPPVPDKGAPGLDDWNLIDLNTQSELPSKQSPWEDIDAGSDKTAKAAAEQQPNAEQALPELPPRKSVEAPLLPPRPVDKSETYQIKNINWHDATAAKNPRTSPILVQNANGPCPLVALVNALILTTPADKSNTALVETLRTREQVSLGLLLEGVFDELMSERRAQPDVPLPDVTELYNFLKGLHTGMNVNPRYMPAPEVVAAFKRTAATNNLPADRIDMIPGTFEHTKEMALYSTFSIPLIHGWLPSRDEAVYGAFQRQASSYEDAQNLLFREEELEEKLSSTRGDGLSEEEQQLYQDILTIKSFLSISATQLTKFGLDVIKTSMKPGSVAILFRNDHFSTLYRHPQTLELFTLVTDAGYAGHAEIVWESLVDVNGESTEFYSGDFRVVGGASHEQPGPSRRRMSGNWEDEAARDDGWTTVQNRRENRRENRIGLHQSTRQRSASQPLLSPAHEQEDRDLALALQLQEEEDARARAEQERRRRESLLSERFIEQQARNPAGAAAASNHTRVASQSTTSLGSSSTGTSATATGRRTSGSTAARPGGTNASSTSVGSNNPAASSSRPRPTTQTVRSLLPPPRTTRPAEEGLDDAPPSYEQAARQNPYVPPVGHPNHPASSPLSPRSGRGRTTTGGSTGGGGGGGRPAGLRRGVPPPPAPGPAHAAVPPAGAGAGGGGGGGRDRECVVM